MREISRTTQFKRDYKREKKGRHSASLDADLIGVLNLLVSDTPIPKKMHDHPLVGKWTDYRDCHIKPDLVLIYRLPDPESLELIRLGSHSQLGL